MRLSLSNGKLAAAAAPFEFGRAKRRLINELDLIWLLRSAHVSPFCSFEHQRSVIMRPRVDAIQCVADGMCWRAGSERWQGLLLIKKFVRLGQELAVVGTGDTFAHG